MYDQVTSARGNGFSVELKTFVTLLRVVQKGMPTAVHAMDDVLLLGSLRMQ